MDPLVRRQAFKFQSGELLLGAGHSGDAASKMQRLNDLLLLAAHLLFNISDVVRVLGAEGAAFDLHFFHGVTRRAVWLGVGAELTLSIAVID